MTTAPISSGRVNLSVPEGALPTAVRTAETMTASRMVDSLSDSGREVAQQILERFSDLGRLSFEQVIGGVDDDELFRFVQLAVESHHAFERADLVGLALDEELWFRARQRVGKRVIHSRHGRHDRRRNADQNGDAIVSGTGFERDPRSE